MPGKLIVLDGTDGSGKSTQFRLVKQALERRRVPFRTMAFPRYQEESSALVRLYLSGAFGSRPDDVNPYAASTFYAVDRYAGYKQDWGDWYESGGLLLSDRYTTSNAIHQGAKLPAGQREAFFRWLEDFEFARLGLPRPDLVLWMDLPIPLAVRNLRRRETDTRTSADLHEADTAYLTACYESAAQAAAFYGWQRVACAGRAGQQRPAEEIQEEIMESLAGSAAPGGLSPARNEIFSGGQEHGAPVIGRRL